MQEERSGDRFMTVKEVAERLHVCRASIYLWLRHGFPQPLKFGRTSRWRAEELEEWIRKRPKGVYGEHGVKLRAMEASHAGGLSGEDMEKLR